MARKSCQRYVMREKGDIFNGGAKAACDVPEGYFEELKARLNDIPERMATPGPMQRMRPYLALAASFAAILIVGNVVLRSTTDRKAVTGDEYNEMAYAALSQAIQVEEYIPSEIEVRDTITDEDVINYLIDSGASAEMIEYTRLLARK